MTPERKDDPLLTVGNLTLKHRGANHGGARHQAAKNGRWDKAGAQDGDASGSTTILHNVSLDLRRGEILGLIGESGAGKSTLGNAILGLLGDGFAQTAGTIVFDGVPMESMDERRWAALRGRRISAIFQDHTASLDPLMAIGPQIEEAVLANNDRTIRKEARAIALDLLARVGIANAAERYHHYPHQFSGGQRQRIVIAIAIAGAPDIIIADEPTSALDATVQKQILGLLRDLVAETGVAVILVTHDMGVLADITDRVVVMRHGEVVEQGVTADLLDAPERRYTRELLAAVPKLRLACDDERTDGREVLPISPASDLTTTAAPDPDTLPILSARNVSKTFSGGGLGWLRKSARKPALHQVSIELARGAITGIVGESGSGKSTIGRIIAGLETAGEGQLAIEGRTFDISRPGHRSGVLGQAQMIFRTRLYRSIRAYPSGTPC